MNHILFPITYECNLSCQFCAVKGCKSDTDIKANMNAIRLKKGEVEWVYITGGEPFLVEELPQVCDDLKDMGFKVGVTTNGTIFRPDVASHVDRIGISLDGDKWYHDAYRGLGVYDKALQLFNAVKGMCETVIMSVAFKGNEQALINLKSVIEQLDPTYWQIQKDMYDPSVTIPAL